MINNLRRISVIEAVSYLALLGAAVIKRTEGSEVGVKVIGPIHGILFLVFAAMLLRDHSKLGWPLWKALSAVFIGSLPLGGFFLERRWLKPLMRLPEESGI